jgi:hypothetical protein
MLLFGALFNLAVYYPLRNRGFQPVIISTIGASILLEKRKRAVNHRTIERRFAPALKKGRHNLAHMLRSQLVRRAMSGDTAALIFACKTILGLREPRGDDFNVHVSATSTANAKPAPFAITEEVKKKMYEAALVIRREALQQNEGRN